jgi:hypothetical protein
VAFVVLEHAGQEFLDQPEVTYDVDLEDLGYEFRRCFDDGLGLAYAGVVDEDTWIAPFETELVGC